MAASKKVEWGAMTKIGASILGACFPLTLMCMPPA